MQDSFNHYILFFLTGITYDKRILIIINEKGGLSLSTLCFYTISQWALTCWIWTNITSNYYQLWHLYLWWVEFEFNRFKKVLDSVGQSNYHKIIQYTSKIKIKKFKTLQSVSPVIGIIRYTRLRVKQTVGF